MTFQHGHQVSTCNAASASGPTGPLMAFQHSISVCQHLGQDWLDTSTVVMTGWTPQVAGGDE